MSGHNTTPNGYSELRHDPSNNINNNTIMNGAAPLGMPASMDPSNVMGMATISHHPMSSMMTGSAPTSAVPGAAETPTTVMTPPYFGAAAATPGFPSPFGGMGTVPGGMGMMPFGGMPPSFMGAAGASTTPGSVPGGPGPANPAAVASPFGSMDAVWMQMQRMQQMQDWFLWQKQQECATLQQKLEASTEAVQSLTVENSLLKQKCAHYEQQLQQQLKLIQLAASHKKAHHHGGSSSTGTNKKPPPPAGGSEPVVASTAPRDVVVQPNPVLTAAAAAAATMESTVATTAEPPTTVMMNRTLKDPPNAVSSTLAAPATLEPIAHMLSIPESSSSTAAAAPGLPMTAGMGLKMAPEEEFVIEEIPPPLKARPSTDDYNDEEHEEKNMESHESEPESTSALEEPFKSMIIITQENEPGPVVLAADRGIGNGDNTDSHQDHREEEDDEEEKKSVEPPSSVPSSHPPNQVVPIIVDPVMGHQSSSPTPEAVVAEKVQNPESENPIDDNDMVAPDMVLNDHNPPEQQPEQADEEDTLYGIPRILITNSDSVEQTTLEWELTQPTIAPVHSLAQMGYTPNPIYPNNGMGIPHQGGRNFDEDARTTATSTVGEDREEVVDRVLNDPYGDQGTYSGIVLKSTGMPHGRGRMKYQEDGRVYDGEWRHGRWHGFGRAWFANGDTYEGEYRFDQRHGLGNYRWSDGRRYEGIFYEDQRHGKGHFIWPDGAEYKGTFVRGQREGHGTYLFSDGGQYEGDWKKGRYHGFGVCQWQDGRTYKGHWENGMAHGQGVETNADGTIRHDGLWIQDEPVDDDHQPLAPRGGDEHL